MTLEEKQSNEYQRRFYDELISNYEKYGFSRLAEKYEIEIHNRLKPEYDESCIFMYRML